MKTALTEMFGIELPIFAFTHCRDVVVEVSKAGGLGVLGAVTFTKEALAQELKWIDEHINGKPYGIDLLIPSKVQRGLLGEAKLALDKTLPKENVEFVNGILDRAGIPPLPADDRDELIQEALSKINVQPEEVDELLEVAYKHPIKLIVSALGIPPKHEVERAHALGIKVGALAGSVKHAMRHKETGVDLVIAQGTEAGGHTGRITSMVLWPEIIEAVAPMPVLAAGGIGRGNQMAAALAMGAAGVWCGSIWMGTKESEYTPEEKEILFEARSEDAVQSPHRTGKPCRMVRSKMSEAWEQPGAPPTLGMPLQTLLMAESQLRLVRSGAKGKEFMSPWVGQIVGMMKQETSVRRIVIDMLNEFADSVQRLMDTVD